MADTYAHIEPLPFVPATCIARHEMGTLCSNVVMRERPGVIMPIGTSRVIHCRIWVTCICSILGVSQDSGLSFHSVNWNNGNKMKHADCIDVSEISNG